MKSGKYYKLGITDDLQERLTAFRNSSPLKVELVFSAESDNPKEVEKKLQEKLKTKQVKGEWYALKKMDIEQLKKDIFPEATAGSDFKHQCVSMREFQRNMYSYLDLAKVHPITITKRDVPTYMLHTPQQANTVSNVASMWNVTYPQGSLENDSTPLKITEIRKHQRHGKFGKDLYEDEYNRTTTTFNPGAVTSTTLAAGNLIADTCTHVGGHSFRTTPEDKFCSHCGEKNHDQK
jgi:hypothetical protein